jgi:hypothetical protein
MVIMNIWGLLVSIYFALQSVLAGQALDPDMTTRGKSRMPLRRVRATSAWIAYFETNLARCRPIPWEEVNVALPAAQLAAIARSLQAWQLGETSDGRHLLAAAARYAQRTQDPAYYAAVELFVREEQRHGELLGRFLDLAGLGRIGVDWGDCLFRALRYCIIGMEVWTTTVVMVETLATIYYNAIRRATGSPVLRTICAQILADEGPHIRFQYERLAIILRSRPRLGFWLTMFAQRLLYFGVVVLVWLGHHRALRAGGYGWQHYWRQAWSKMTLAWQRMDPRQYEWEN